MVSSMETEMVPEADPSNCSQIRVVRGGSLRNDMQSKLPDTPLYRNAALPRFSRDVKFATIPNLCIIKMCMINRCTE